MSRKYDFQNLNPTFIESFTNSIELVSEIDVKEEALRVNQIKSIQVMKKCVGWQKQKSKRLRLINVLAANDAFDDTQVAGRNRS